MSITLNSLTTWLYRLRAMRMAGAAQVHTLPNANDDLTRVRDDHDDERRLLRNNGAVTRLSAAREQRDALRDQIIIL
jgi:hypothetical protein